MKKHVNYALKVLERTPILSISMLWKKKIKYTLVCAINSKGIVGFELYEIFI
tara:strand:- start:2547 stop:2702 length:156 start_codon:yes stop_codon:yes gene_type:complete